MARIGSIKLNTFSFGNGIQTRRQCLDNSEIYISSKLSRLYQQAVADCFVSQKLDSMKKFTNNQ